MVALNLGAEPSRSLRTLLGLGGEILLSTLLDRKGETEYEAALDLRGNEGV